MIMAWFTIAWAAMHVFVLGAIVVEQLRTRRSPDFDGTAGIRTGDVVMLILFMLPILVGGWQAIHFVLT